MMTLKVVKSQGRIKLVQVDGKVVTTLATLSAEDGNRLGVTLLKTAAVLGAIAELKGAAREEILH